MKYIHIFLFLICSVSLFAQRIQFNSKQSFVDSTRLVSDSILVYYQNGSIIKQDTLRGLGEPFSLISADITGDYSKTLQITSSDGTISSNFETYPKYSVNTRISYDGSTNVVSQFKVPASLDNCTILDINVYLTDENTTVLGTKDTVIFKLANITIDEPLGYSWSQIGISGANAQTNKVAQGSSDLIRLGTSPYSYPIQEDEIYAVIIYQYTNGTYSTNWSDIQYSDVYVTYNLGCFPLGGASIPGRYAVDTNQIDIIVPTYIDTIITDNTLLYTEISTDTVSLKIDTTVISTIKGLSDSLANFTTGLWESSTDYIKTQDSLKGIKINELIDSDITLSNHTSTGYLLGVTPGLRTEGGGIIYFDPDTYLEVPGLGVMGTQRSSVGVLKYIAPQTEFGEDPTLNGTYVREKIAPVWYVDAKIAKALDNYSSLAPALDDYTLRTTTTQTGDITFADTTVLVTTKALNDSLADYVTLSTNQTITGEKTFTATTVFDDSTLVIDAVNNRIGIGTISPSNKLHVGSAIGAGSWMSAVFTDGIGVAEAGTSRAAYLYSSPNIIGVNAYDYSSSTYEDVSIGWGGSGVNVYLARDGGKVGIGTNTPVSELHVAGTVTATSFVETSSARYKTNIQPLDYTDVVSKLVPVSYIVKETNKPDIGFIAEDMDKVISQLVMYNDKGEPEAINYTKLIPILVKEIQELRKEIEILKTK